MTPFRCDFSRRRFSTMAVISLPLLLVAGAVQAAGQRDSGFGTDGVVKENYPDTTLDNYQAAAVLSDTSILTAGITNFGVPDSKDPLRANDLFIGRFDSNGSLVYRLTVHDALVASPMTGVSVSAEGLIVVVGFDSTSGGALRPEVRKYDAAGQLLGSFSPPHPPSTYGIPTLCQGKGVLFETGGKLVVPCLIQNRTNGLDYPALARLNSDMTLDASFGNDFNPNTPEFQRDGYALGPSPGGAHSEGFPQGTAVVSDGSGGYYMLVTNADPDSSNEGTASDIDASLIVNHFFSDGTLDTSYGVGGIAVVASTAGQQNLSIDGNSLFLDSAGRLVVGGSRFNPGASALVARLNPDGTLDNQFGEGGIIDPLLDPVGGGFSAIALFGDSSNRLYVLNSRTLTRLTSAGDPDPTFDPSPSNLRNLHAPAENNAKWGGAAVVDGGNSVLLMGGVDQFPVVTGGTSSAVATLAKINLDGQAPPPARVVRFEETAVTVSEGNGPAPVVVSVKLSEASANNVTVPFTFSGSASPADYSLPNGGSIVIPAGQTTGSLSVVLVDDGLDEANETLSIRLGTPTGASIGAPNTLALKITDNDAPPSVSFDKAASHVSEGAQSAVSVQLSAASGKGVTVNFSVAGSASEADYHLSPTTHKLYFPPGSTRRTVVIKTTNDVADERNESVVLTLNSATSATIGGTSVRTVVIADND